MKEWRALPKVSKTSLFITAFTAFSCILGIDIHTPSLPAMVDSFRTTNDILQMAVPIFVLGAGLGIVMWGPLADQYGRRPIIMAGVSIVTVSAAIAATVSNIWVFLSLRFLQGIGSGAAMCLGRVIAADLLAPKELATIGSTMGLVTGMAPMLAPVIGGYIEESIGWQGSFVFYACQTSIALLLFALFYTESLHKPHHSSIIKRYSALLIKKRFILLGLLQGTVLSVINCYALVAPFLVLEEMKQSAIFFGWVSFLCASCQLLSKLSAPSYIRRFGPRRVNIAGWCVLFVSALLLILRYNYYLEDELFQLIVNLPYFSYKIDVLTSYSQLFFIGSIGLAFYSIHLIIPYLFREVMSLPSFGKGILGAGFSATGMIFSSCLSSMIAFIPYEGSGLLGGYYCALALFGLALSSWAYRIKKGA